MFILQIVFHQTVENYNSSASTSFWWDLSKDFILPILLGALAAYGAYFIFIKQTSAERYKEQKKQEEERSDKLIFFSAVVESALRTSLQQKDNIKEYVREMGKDDVNFLLMTQVPLDDLKRISETLDLEEYLLAYANYYKANRTLSIKEFKNIIASFDFLYFMFQNILTQLEKAQKFDYERKLKMQDLFEKAYRLVGPLMVNFERSDEGTFAEVSKIYNEFMDNHSGNNYDITFYYKFFFIPFNDFCVNYLTSERRIINEVFDLATFTRDGKQLFMMIKSENNDRKNNFIGDFKNIYRVLTDLKVDSRNLIKDF